MTIRKVAFLALAVSLIANLPSVTRSEVQRLTGWQAVAPMQEARRAHSMVVLPAGAGKQSRVMVIGGYDRDPIADTANATSLASTEIYDPASDTWSYAAPHPFPAGYRWAIALDNGMVLVVGGWNSEAGFTHSANLTASHLYDPRTDHWVVTAPLPIAVVNPHSFMRPVALKDGRVLIAGGLFYSDDAGAYVLSQWSFVFKLDKHQPHLSHWDYTRNQATNEVSELSDARTTAAVLLLNDGRVLSVGGLGAEESAPTSWMATNTSDLFDPRTGLWTRGAPMPPVLGLGEDEFITPYPTVPGSRWAPLGVTLKNGDVLIAGGVGGLFEVLRASSVVYRPNRNSWTIGTPMHFARAGALWGAELPGQKGVLIAGFGFDALGDINVTGEIYRPNRRSWTLVPPSDDMPNDGSVDSVDSQLVVRRDGVVQVTGGPSRLDFFGASSESWILDVN